MARYGAYCVILLSCITCNKSENGGEDQNLFGHCFVDYPTGTDTCMYFYDLTTEHLDSYAQECVSSEGSEAVLTWSNGATCSEEGVQGTCELSPPSGKNTEYYYNSTYSEAQFKELLCAEGDFTFNEREWLSDPDGIFVKTQSITPGYLSYAALRTDGSVVFWGSEKEVDISNVKSEISLGVKKVYITKGSIPAFAALKEDGSVITWGNADSGGNSLGVAEDLKSGVSSIYSNYGTFAAIKEDGSVVIWGDDNSGGNGLLKYTNENFEQVEINIKDQLSSNVVDIKSGDHTFIAIKSDKSAIAWGHHAYYDTRSVESSLSSGVENVYVNDGSFAALKEDGSVVTWGTIDSGGNSTIANYNGNYNEYEDISSKISSGVKEIYFTQDAFAALKEDGSVVTWGDGKYGGATIVYADDVGPVDGSDVSSQLSSGVSKIFSTNSYKDAFAALKNDGSVVTWGNSESGADSSSVSSLLSSGVVDIASTGSAFAALKEDGSVVTWGKGYNSSDSSEYPSKLSSGVKAIYGSYSVFSALKDDESIIVWGTVGHEEIPAKPGLKVTEIYSNFSSFAFLYDDGSIDVAGSDISKIRNLIQNF